MLLGLEGCLPVAGPGPSMTAPAPGVSTQAGPAPIAENRTASIPVADLLASQAGAEKFIAVTSAEHGSAQVNGSVVSFTPESGYEGEAVINFQYTTRSGERRTGGYRLLVDDAAAGVTPPVSSEPPPPLPPSGDGGDDEPPAGGHDDDHGDSHGDGHGEDPGDGHGDGHGEDDAPSSGTPHADDPQKRAEHEALMNLVPASEATHIAVRDGSWFDPATWANGEVPGDGAKVLIPDGRHVEYDGESTASIFTIRVDGLLEFATDRDTFLEVDTFVVSPSGELTVGTMDSPVAAGVEAVISIAANGPIDAAWDPFLLSRGLVSHGAVQIHGAEKESFARVAVDPLAGATSVTLEEAPQGWRVGDRIVIAGTHLTQTGSYDQDEARLADYTEDEERVITAINGATVTFDAPLAYSHEGARPDLKTYVANYTRNVRFESENGDSVPASERGHAMFMHSDDIDVRYAEFRELGRTDKSTRAFDLADLAHVEPDSNIKGRYSLHIHRVGVGDPADPAMVVGNAVWGSPGWGFVQHDSNAIFAGNAAYDVFGAAFVAESGNETGRWVDNIAIKSIGVFTGPKDAEDVHAFDLGRGGAGFWFQGRLIEAVGNVAAGSPGGHGFVYMTRQLPEDVIQIDPDVVQNGDKLRYLDSVPPNFPNIAMFRDNEAFAVAQGLEVIKASPEQRNDVRSIIDGFTGWEVRSGIVLQYTSHYTLKDIDLLSAQGISPTTWPISRGLALETNTFDITVNRAVVDGFDKGIAVHHQSFVDGVTDFQYVFIDVELRNNAIGYSSANPGFSDRFLSSADLHAVAVSYTPARSLIDDIEIWYGVPPVEVRGRKTDSLGTIETSTVWDPFFIDYVSVRGAVEENGYWSLADGRKVTLVEEYVADRATGALEKFPIWVEIPSAMNLSANADAGSPRITPVYHGVLDPANSAPVAADDTASARPGERVVIDVLANDFDPEGRTLVLDSLFSERGHVVANDDGTVSYFADPGFEGADVFYYWAQDDSGNFTKAQVTVTVEI